MKNKMKKLFALFGLLMACASIQAQEYAVKADLFKQHERADTLSDFPNWGDPQEDSTLIMFTKDSLIVIDNKEKDCYRLISLINTSKGIDKNDDDPWFGVKWLAIDNSGIKAIIVIQVFISKTVMLTIRYGNIEYRYQCSPLKKLHNKQPMV
jgi:hypothetical protein